MDREPGISSGCPRTYCACQNLASSVSAFLREPSKHIELPLSSQAVILLNQACNFHIFGGRFTCRFDRHSGEVNRPQKVALRKISKIDQRQIASRTRAHERNFLPGHAMDCSLRDSLQGLTLPHPTQRTSFPLPSIGAGHKGHREALLLICNFSRVAQATLQCKSRIGPRRTSGKLDLVKALIFVVDLTACITVR